MFQNLHRFIRSYFGFSKNETKGFFVLSGVIIFALIAPFIFNATIQKKEAPFNETALRKIIEDWEVQKSEKKSGKNFKKPLINSSSKNDSPENIIPHKSAPPIARRKENLNGADTASLKNIYGVGPTLSVRILKYKDLLGGFVNLQQLSEVYGLNEEVIQRMKNNYFIQPTFTPYKININTADFKTLIRHPYIDKNMVIEILNRRKLNAELKKSDIEDLIYNPLLEAYLAF